MYCAKCGKKNADDRLFCGFCGSPLDTPDAPAPEKDEERRLYGRPESAFAEREREEDVAPRPRRAARHAKPMEASAEDDAGQPADGAETAVRREARSAREEEAARRRYGRPEGKEDAEPREAFRSAGEEEEDSRRRYGRPEEDVEPPIAPREARSAREEEAARRRYGRPEGEDNPRSVSRSASEEEERYGRLEEEEGPREASRSEEEEDEPVDPLARPLLNKPVELRVQASAPALAYIRAGKAPRGYGRAPGQYRSAPARTRSGQSVFGR